MYKRKIINPGILSMMLLLLVSTLSTAQVRLNLKAGLNSSTLDLKDNGPAEADWGYQIGVDLRIGNSFYIAPGIHLLSQRSKLDSDNKEFNSTGLRVPVFLGGDLIKNEKLGLRAYVGPSAFFILNDSELTTQIENFQREDINWGIDVGVGTDLGVFTIDLQHSWGFNDLVELRNTTARNRTFYVLVGILF